MTTLLPPLSHPPFAPDAIAPPAPRPPTILVVDDEEVIRAVLAAVLRAHGMAVVTAENASVAQHCLESHQVDAVLTDLHMPGMNGIELCAWITARVARRPSVWLMTGSNTSRLGHAATSAGAVRVLQKPFTLREVAAEIVEHLGARGR